MNENASTFNKPYISLKTESEYDEDSSAAPDKSFS